MTEFPEYPTTAKEASRLPPASPEVADDLVNNVLNRQCPGHRLLVNTSAGREGMITIVFMLEKVGGLPALAECLAVLNRNFPWTKITTAVGGAVGGTITIEWRTEKEN